MVMEQQEHREQAVTAEGPGVLFTGDGMMQSKRAQWYYRRLKEGEYHGVILTGHLARGSFGQRLLQAEADPNCSLQVQAIRYKVHQGLPDVRSMLQLMPSTQTILVHNGKIATDTSCQQLTDEGFTGLHSMVPGEMISS
ncbi:Beta-Casp domain protein [compost metagenome]